MAATLPTSERDLVRALAMFGVSEETIAQRVRMSVGALRTRYADDLRDGASDGVITALQTLYEMAVGRDGDPEQGIRKVNPDKKALMFYLQHVAAVTRSANPNARPPPGVAEETGRQIIRTIVGSPEEVAQFLLMRRQVQQKEDAEDGVIIDGNGERADF